MIIKTKTVLNCHMLLYNTSLFGTFAHTLYNNIIENNVWIIPLFIYVIRYDYVEHERGKKYQIR